MKKTKRLLTVILSLFLIFTLSINSFAQTSHFDKQEEITYPKVDETVTVIEDIAIIHFCAVPLGGYFLFGHAWVYIENISENEIQIGAYTLEPGKSISVGTSSFAGKNGWRLYYNLETFTEKDANYISIKDTISLDELDAMNKVIRNYNHWNPIINCTFSSSAIWNTVSDKHLIPMVFPIFSMIQMWIHGTDDDFRMGAFEKGTICVQDKFGDKAKAIPINESELEGYAAIPAEQF